MNGFTTAALTILFKFYSLTLVYLQVNDIKFTRIDYMLKEISETMLCDLPERTPWSVPMFLTNLEVYLF